MTMTTVPLTTSWGIVTNASTFIAQNRSTSSIEVAFAASTPGPDEEGLLIEPNLVVTNDNGTGALYAKGKGIIIVVT